MTPALSIVIPVYNEKENIPVTLAEIASKVSTPHEILIVYDTDNDTTVPVVKELMRSRSNLFLLKNNVARGPSGAIRTGLSFSKAPWILVMMGDLCDDVSQISEMLKMTDQADLICPSRYCPGGSQDLGGLKVWAPRAAGFLLKHFGGLPTYDPTNSFKLYSREVIQSMRLKSTVSFSVTLEIVAKAHILGFRIVEIPTTWKVRLSGKSNFKLGRSLIVYLPWFALAMLRGRFFRLPRGVVRMLAGSPKDSRLLKGSLK